MNTQNNYTFMFQKKNCLLLILLLSFSVVLGQQKNDKKMQSFKLAMLQMKVDAGKPTINLQRAEERISEAAKNGARLALLPEAMDLGWTDPSAKTMAFEIPAGETCQKLSKIAKENRIYVCAGIIEKEGNLTFNSAIIINPAGEIILKHRKLNELDIAHNLYAQGDRLGTVQTELGNLGLFICADATAIDNTLSHSLGYMRADIILSPCAWAVPPDYDNKKTPYGDTWRKSYKDVSSKFDLWIFGVSNVGKIEKGPWKNWDCIGASLAFSPAGNEVLQAPFGVDADTIIYVDVEIKERPARGTEWYNFNSKKN